jgi:SPP1 gp7 family putative phage head morphogenesis protein
MTTPAELYRNAVDLNRFSNSVARQITRTYSDIIVDAMERLAGVGADPTLTQATRLQAILAQLKGSLDGWAGTATALSAEELQGLVELQTRFVTEVLDGELPDDLLLQVKSVQISPQFAQAVATVDPTTYNVVTLSDDLGAAVTGVPKSFRLDVGAGSTITLPNGAGLATSFKRLAGKQAEIFTKEVRSGLVLGEPTDKIARRLRRQLIAVPNNQIKAMVRTSVNQVANAASQAVYSQNQDITKKYRYIATLDGRTSAICRALDGQEFAYGKGPTPPQHFNCRSTTVPIVDYEGLGIAPPKPGKRRSSGGLVPSDQTYGQWLHNQSKEVKADVLGPEKVPYFNRLARKYGPTNAIRRFVSEDGSELTLEQLRRRYPNGTASK